MPRALAPASLDALVSNPPYLTASGVRRPRSGSVRDWEPALALSPAARRPGRRSRVARCGACGCAGRRVARAGARLCPGGCTRAWHARRVQAGRTSAIQADLFGRERYLLARRSDRPVIWDKAQELGRQIGQSTERPGPSPGRRPRLREDKDTVATPGSDPDAGPSQVDQHGGHRSDARPGHGSSRTRPPCATSSSARWGRPTSWRASNFEKLMVEGQPADQRRDGEGRDQQHHHAGMSRQPGPFIVLEGPEELGKDLARASVSRSDERGGTPPRRRSRAGMPAAEALRQELLDRGPGV